jgi:hypothetical protein
METGTALVRAAAAAAAARVDVVNMSFGEATAVCNSGRVVEVLTDLVERDGVVFLASAGARFFLMAFLLLLRGLVFATFCLPKQNHPCLVNKPPHKTKTKATPAPR